MHPDREPFSWGRKSTTACRKVVKSVSMGIYILLKSFSGKPSFVVTPKGSVPDSLDFLVFYGTNFPLCSLFLLLAFTLILLAEQQGFKLLLTIKFRRHNGIHPRPNLLRLKRSIGQAEDNA